jgi:hypothetical protein
MGSTDYGTQTLGFDYNQSATAQGFNGVYYNAISTGLYTGFTLTRTSNTSVTISSGLCVISDSSSSTITKVSTSNSVTIAVSSSIPYIIFRFSWSDSTNNYMDMEAVAYDNIESDDLVIGRCIYEDDGTTLQTTFDYTRRSTVFTKKFETQNDYFRVYQTEPASNKVTITGGVINTSEGNITVSGGTFPASGFTDTTNGRIDLIYINEDGDIEVLEGTDASSPSVPRYANRKVIAEITRGAGETTVKGNEITRVISSFDANPISSDMLITDSGGYYTSTDVESALEEIAGNNFSFYGTKTFKNIILNGLSDTVTETMTGASGQNIQVIKKYGGTTVQYVDQNGKLYNTIGISLAFSDTYSKYTTDEVGSALNQISGGDMSIAGTKTFTTMPVLGSSTTVGSSIIPVYLSSGHITASTSTVGSAVNPVYLNSGAITASTSTIGGATIPVYLNSGTITALSTTIGSTSKPVYVSSGALTACSSTVGSDVIPTYMLSGTVTASTSTVGGTVTPVYLNSGTITALSTTVGGTAKPVYVNAGALTASNSTIGSGTKPIYMSSGTLTASSSTVGTTGIPIYLNTGVITACTVDSTPTVSSTNLITSGAVYSYVNYASRFTFVVDSNSALALWANATGGYDFSSVLIRSGTWTLASGCIDLTTAGTKVVIGEPKSVLVFSSSITGLQYTSLPSTDDYYITGVTISLSYTSTMSASAFYLCRNVTNCKAVVSVTSTATGIGFNICTNLINCTSTSTAVSGANGFISCTNLINCTSTASSSANGYGRAFQSCSNLTNCVGTGSATGSPYAGYGFSDCNDIVNCTGTGSSTGTGGGGYGFQGCSCVTGCIGTGTGLSSGYGFSSSLGISKCRKGDTCTTATFRTTNCSANQTGYDSAYVVADTPNGGFNDVS